jgi:hypothetical protein
MRSELMLHQARVFANLRKKGAANPFALAQFVSEHLTTHVTLNVKE